MSQARALKQDHLNSLIVRAKGGDSRAFTELIQATQNQLFKVCFHLTGSKNLAEELAQETYIKAVQNLEKMSPDFNLMAWLFQVARNLMIDKTRTAEHKVERLSDQADSTGLDAIMVSQEPEDREAIIQLQRALNAMEPEDRWILVMFHLEERSSGEISKMLGIGESAVRMRVLRAKKIFMELYGKH